MKNIFLLLCLIFFLSLSIQQCAFRGSEWIVYEKVLIDRPFAKVDKSKTKGQISQNQSHIILASPSGRTKKVLKKDFGLCFPRLSPDRKWVSFISNSLFYSVDEYGQTWPAFHEDIHLMDRHGKNERSLTDDLSGRCETPSWSPDGKYLVFVFQPKKNREAFRHTGEILLCLINVETKELQKIGMGGQIVFSPVFSPDGSKILYLNHIPQFVTRGGHTTQVGGGQNQKIEIWSMDRDGKNKKQLTQGELDQSPSFLPDGSKIIFVRRSYKDQGPYWGEAPVMSVYIMNSDGTAVQKVIEDGEYPRFSPDGEKIIFTRFSRSLPIAKSEKGEILVADADGRKIRKIVRQSLFEGRTRFYAPDWR